MAELLFQRVKLRLSVVIIAFVFGELHQVLHISLAFAVILKSALHGKLLEVVVIGIAYHEVTGRCDGGMRLHILQFPVKERLCRVHSA